MKQIYREDAVSKVTVTFATNQTKEQQDEVLRDFSQAAYNLCLYEYNRRLKKANENKDNTGAIKSIE